MATFPRSLVAASAAALCLAAAASGQATPATADGTLLRPGVDTFHVLAGRDTIGYGVQALERAEGAGGPAWLQVYRFHPRKGAPTLDSLVVDGRTLLPVRQVRRNERMRADVAYDGSRVRVSSTPAGAGPTSADMRFDVPVYSSSSIPLLARALPLAEGFATEVHTYNPGPFPATLERLTLQVEGTETVVGRAGKEAGCWVDGASTKGGGTLYWIDRETREVVRFVVMEGGEPILFTR
jgi:hypothetical protein